MSILLPNTSILMVLLTAVLLSAGVGAAAPSDGIEYKLQVRPDVFADGRQSGDERLAGVLAETAARAGTGFEVTPGDRVRRSLVTYLDTANGVLAAHDMVLRQTFRLKDGRPAERGSLTLKRRQAAPISAADIEVFVAGLDDNASVKKETDRVGLADGVPGRVRSASSVSAKLKTMAVDGLTLGECAERFPVLGTLGSAPGAKIRTVSTVRAAETVPGRWVIDGRRFEIEVVTWRSDHNGPILQAELSWKVKTGEGDVVPHERLFRSLQDRPDVFAPGRMKRDAFYYSP